MRLVRIMSKYSNIFKTLLKVLIIVLPAIAIVAIGFGKIFEISLKALPIHLKNLLPIFFAMAIVMIYNKSMLHKSIEKISDSKLSWSNLIPIIGALSHHARAQEEIQENFEDTEMPFKPLNILLLVGYLFFLFSVFKLLFTVKSEGLLYETVEVNINIIFTLLNYALICALNQLLVGAYLNTLTEYTSRNTATLFFISVLSIVICTLSIVSIGLKIKMPILNVGLIQLISVSFPIFIMPAYMFIKTKAIGNEIYLEEVEED